MEIEEFKEAIKILESKGMYSEIMACLEHLNTQPKKVREINNEIKRCLRQGGWRCNESLDYKHNVRYQYDLTKDRAGIEIELSFQNKMFHELTRLEAAYRDEKIDVGVIITNRYLDNIKASSKEAYATYAQTLKWFKLCYELKIYSIPLLLVGIR